MIKRISALLLSLMLIVSLAACGSSPSKAPISADGDKSPGSQSAAPEGQSSSEEAPAVTIEKTVLLDQDGLVVTATELTEDPIWGMRVNLLIENNSDKNLGVQCKSVVVNNYMISNLFSSSVAPGKKANDSIDLSSKALEAAGIKTISDIVIRFHVFEKDSFAKLFDTEEIELKTSAYGTVEQPKMDDGIELVNQDGVRIVGKYVEEDSFWGAGVLLFIENTSENSVTIQCESMSINGFMVNPMLSSAVDSGRMAVDDITLLSSDLEKNKIETIEDVEVAFKIIDTKTFKTIVKTEPISFTVK